MINNIKTFSLFLLLPFISLSCGSSKKISGIYHSKFASLGTFGTITLRPDSTIVYVFRGDLLYDSAGGHYQAYGPKDKARSDANAVNFLKPFNLYEKSI